MCKLLFGFVSSRDKHTRVTQHAFLLLVTHPTTDLVAVTSHKKRNKIGKLQMCIVVI